MVEDPEWAEAPTAETSSRRRDDALTPMAPGEGSHGKGLPLSPGQVLAERYWIQRLLGRGGMGQVWQALDLKLRVDVALKSLHPKFYANESLRELLRGEVRAAREVISPNVCRVYDLLELEGRELLSMEHIDGTTLLSLLKERAPLPLTEARDLALQFLTGLEAVHQSGLVHRDFKPENVMITRSGRVVVMDFGIAQRAKAADGSVAGTPAYMAPEQSRGDGVDPRTDLYAVGVVLAEMVSQAGVQDQTSRKSIWEGIREDPPRIPDSPWSPVIRKAVAPDPAERPGSAQALIRSLEEITLRVEGADEKHPYPGLASFTEGDAEHFFGREPEIESMWRRLHRAHLLALAGPSGAGKSSFLRAGLLSALPDGWSHVYCQPGEQPFSSLARALATESPAGGATPPWEGPEGQEGIIATARRWGEGHEECLVILDQFEELFTLNTSDVQARFSELVGRLASEVGIRVLVSMRDDFLFRCQGHPALAPLFLEPTPLAPPAGAALQRALVQPALSLGYRFEDSSLIQVMLDEVSRERGALPLLAFAAAGLWERRDREEGLLTRQAYEGIGGVGGALAQHAEETLARIGVDGEPIVRELFRNLVTAQGTRAVRDRDELLSVFEDRSMAEPVLEALIEARLLTSFEVPDGTDESAPPTRRVEIIHESLLSNWPRLVRWRTQDADGAQLRDQLRQVARVWSERGRPEGLLWTGAAFLEYRAWRQRYSGGLSETEEAFARATTELAGRRRRFRQLAVAAVIGVLSVGLATIGSFWREALAETRRAEASKLLALGRVELEKHPTAALAYAAASLERHDDPTARRFLMEVLWRGPTQIQITTSEGWDAWFTPDGEWILRRSADRALHELWPRNGGGPRPLPSGEDAYRPLRDTLGLVSWSVKELRTSLWSLPDIERVHTFTGKPGEGLAGWAAGRLYTTRNVERNGRRGLTELRSQALDGSPPRSHGRFWATTNPRIGPEGRWLVVRDGKDAFALNASNLAVDGRRRLTRFSSSNFGSMLTAFSYSGHVAIGEPSTGTIQEWSLAESPASPTTFQGGAGLRDLVITRDGARLASTASDQLVRIWDRTGPPDTEPVVLRQGEVGQLNSAQFDPSGSWLLTLAPYMLSIWPMARDYPLILRGHTRNARDVAFTPSGGHLVTTSTEGTVRLWPLTTRSDERSRVLVRTSREAVGDLAIDPGGRYAVTSSDSGRVRVISLPDGATRVLEGFTDQSWEIAVGPKGRLVASGGGGLNFEQRKLIKVWDLESDQVWTLERGEEELSGQLHFARDGRLIFTGHGGLRAWSPDDKDSQLLTFAVAGQERSWDDVSLFVLGPERELIYARAQERDELFRLDVRAGTATPIPIALEWDSVKTMVVDPTGSSLVTGHEDGNVRMTPLDGGPSHLLLGHSGRVRGVAVSPDGRWIASAGNDTTVRLWPRPEGVPFHTLPRDELLERLRALTNIRAVEDEGSPTGYSLGADPFPGWESLPTW